MSESAASFSSMHGKVLLLSGASRGVGECVARLAVERGAAGLALVGRDTKTGEALAKELSSLGTRTIFISADLAKPDEPTRIVKTVDETFGVVHGLLNSAAETSRGSVWNTTPEMFDTMMAVNVRAPFMLLQGCAKIMKREGVAGAVVNIGSVTGYGGDVNLTHYAISKGALHTLTRNCAYSLMRDRIRVNLLNPGWMDTPTEDATQRKWHGAQDGWLQKAESQQPLKRLIKPDELARTIMFLLSDESGLMTGAVIDFDQSVVGAGSPSKPKVGEVWP
ncbi:MAG: SDR family oxidoreductase [Actinomycetota bacterium]|nr:SDR family oxidoreductase [Actinomycetota bacterium]